MNYFLSDLYKVNALQVPMPQKECQEAKSLLAGAWVQSCQRNEAVVLSQEAQ